MRLHLKLFEKTKSIPDRRCGRNRGSPLPESLPKTDPENRRGPAVAACPKTEIEGLKK